jgi:hypothetical protein
MTVEQAGNFLIGSILAGMGFCIITIAILVINNLFHKYWKPVTWGILPESMKGNYRFQPSHEYIEPHEPAMGPALDPKTGKPIESELDGKSKK